MNLNTVITLNSAGFLGGMNTCMGALGRFYNLATAGRMIRVGVTGIVGLGDDLNNIARRMGATVSETMVLREAFARANVESGAMAAMVRDNTTALGGYGPQARLASEVTKELGLNQAELLRMPVAQRIEAQLRAISRLTTQEERLYAGRALLGQSGGDVAMQIDPSSIAAARRGLGELPGVIERNAQTFSLLDDRFREVRLQTTNIAAGMTVELLPALERFVSALKSADAAGFGKTLGKSIAVVLQSLSVMIETLNKIPGGAQIAAGALTVLGTVRLAQVVGNLARIPQLLELVRKGTAARATATAAAAAADNSAAGAVSRQTAAYIANTAAVRANTAAKASNVVAGTASILQTTKIGGTLLVPAGFSAAAKGAAGAAGGAAVAKGAGVTAAGALGGMSIAAIAGTVLSVLGTGAISFWLSKRLVGDRIGQSILDAGPKRVGGENLNALVLRANRVTTDDQRASLLAELTAMRDSSGDDMQRAFFERLMTRLEGLRPTIFDIFTRLSDTAAAKAQGEEDWKTRYDSADTAGQIDMLRARQAEQIKRRDELSGMIRNDRTATPEQREGWSAEREQAIAGIGDTSRTLRGLEQRQGDVERQRRLFDLSVEKTRAELAGNKDLTREKDRQMRLLERAADLQDRLQVSSERAAQMAADQVDLEMDLENKGRRQAGGGGGSLGAGADALQRIGAIGGGGPMMGPDARMAGHMGSSVKSESSQETVAELRALGRTLTQSLTELRTIARKEPGGVFA